MSFAPRPPVSACQASASIAAGFRATSGTRVAASQAAAPESIAGMSRPWSAAGRRPTAESSEVRPPTQSHIGKRSSQPPSRPPRRARCRRPSRRPRASRIRGRPPVRVRRASSIPLRVSFVPPDFEITTVSVAGRPPSVAAIRESSRAMPSGSVLSKKNGRSGSRGEPERVRDELRPERRAADADDEEVREVRRLGTARSAPREPRRRSPRSGRASRGSRRRSRRRALARGPAASSGRPCASRPGSRSRPSRARPSP
jgi:hypothetical protein